MTNEEHTDNAQGATRDAETQAAEAKVEKMFEYGYRKSNYGPDELVTDANKVVEKLIITDPVRFWESSKILIISCK